MAAMVITLGKSREHNGNKFPEKLLLINKSLYLHVGPSTCRGGGWWWVVMGGPGVNFKFKTDWILFDGEKLANESVWFLQ